MMSSNILGVGTFGWFEGIWEMEITTQKDHGRRVFTYFGNLNRITMQ